MANHTQRITTKAPHGKETVQQKAIRLYRSGKVRRLHGDVYQVQGDTGIYEVNDERRTCPCDSRLYCSHRSAVEIAVAKLNAKTARLLEAKRAERTERISFSAEQVMANIERLGA